MANPNKIKECSNEKLYAMLKDSKIQQFNPGLIYLVQQEINKRWLKSWLVKPKPKKENIKWESTEN